MIPIITTTSSIHTFGSFCTILLIGLLIVKELADASTWKNAEKLSKNTTYIILPPLFMFCATVWHKVAEVL